MSVHDAFLHHFGYGVGELGDDALCESLWAQLVEAGDNLAQGHATELGDDDTEAHFILEAIVDLDHATYAGQEL